MEKSRVKPLNNCGGSRIRTYEPFPTFGFQGQRFQPLSHASNVLWEQMDLNHCRPKSADLQSALIDHSSILPL